MTLERKEDITVILTISFVQIKIKQKLIIVNNRQTQNSRWDRQSLNQKEKMNKYREVQQISRRSTTKAARNR